VSPSTNIDLKYWNEYSNLQKTKHDLIRFYLGGWFAKLGSWSGRVLYFDTHAGRGKHLSGELGSPLVALTTLLSHSARDRLLQNCKFSFFFIEKDDENLSHLTEEIEALGKLPKGIDVQPMVGDFSQRLEEVLSFLNDRHSRMAPAFVFVDPYGFSLPGSLLRAVMNSGKVELFINVIWRELDMAIAQAKQGLPSAAGLAKTLDTVFAGPDWRVRIDSPDFDTRANQAVDLLAEILGARWATHIRMLGDNRVTRYLLLHLTNHDDGRDLMKDCMWRVCPDGGFYARKSDAVSQEYLISPTADLRPLREKVIERLSERPQRWHELVDWLRSEVWRAPHLTEVLRELRAQKQIEAEDFDGRFGPKADPLLRLTAN
jgi:three-Cys-motif partner protein